MQHLQHLPLVTGLLQLNVKPHPAMRHPHQVGQQGMRRRVGGHEVVLEHEPAIGGTAQIRLDRICAEVDRRLKRLDPVVG